MSNIFYSLRKAGSWRIGHRYDPGAEINIYGLSKRRYLDNYSNEFRGIHLIRDPRDIVVSGYFSHLKTHPENEWT